ncbi:UPF0449 family protein [Leptolyngbya sp. 'hensonii']|nr:UPF0449 family protein [Leptolyngbya sp. 'hensonii']
MISKGGDRVITTPMPPTVEQLLRDVQGYLRRVMGTATPHL